jgi:mono/diheme cytochrome c family protein
MTRKGITVLVVLLLLLSGAIALGVWFINRGFSAREEPSWIETVLARQARKIATPAEAEELKNPHPVTEASKAEAREHYVAHCSICHGIDGRGDTAIGRNLYPKVPDMTQEDTQLLYDGELYYIISNGVRFTGMPAWGDEDSPESIWALVAFIRRLPKLPPEELKQMKEMAEGGEREMEESSPQKKTTNGKHTHDAGAKPHKH